MQWHSPVPVQSVSGSGTRPAADAQRSDTVTDIPHPLSLSCSSVPAEEIELDHIPESDPDTPRVSTATPRHDAVVATAPTVATTSPVVRQSAVAKPSAEQPQQSRSRRGKRGRDKPRQSASTADKEESARAPAASKRQTCAPGSGGKSEPERPQQRSEQPQQRLQIPSVSKQAHAYGGGETYRPAPVTGRFLGGGEGGHNHPHPPPINAYQRQQHISANVLDAANKAAAAAARSAEALTNLLEMQSKQLVAAHNAIADLRFELEKADSLRRHFKVECERLGARKQDFSQEVDLLECLSSTSPPTALPATLPGAVMCCL